MYLIVGLGNPSPKYDHTPHNAGREAVAVWTAEASIMTGEKPEPNELSIPGFYGHAYRGVIGDEEIIVVPDTGTFMNESGPAVQKILSFYKIEAGDLILVHDELAIPLGSLKIGRDLSAGGHNGVQSVIESVGTKDFIRVRIGVETREDHSIPSEDFVTKKMSASEWDILLAVIPKTTSALSTLLLKDLETAMNEFNRNETNPLA